MIHSIGIAGPVSLKILAPYVKNGESLPEGYRFAPMAFWVEELLKRGHQVSVFTLAPQIIKPITFFGEQLTIHIGRYRGHGRARDFFRLERSDLFEAMQKDQVEIIHANWTYEFALAALKTGIPTLVTAHDAPLEILKLNRNPYHFMRCLMAKQVCSLAPIMTVVSSYLENHFRRVFKYRRPIYLIPNGIPEFVFNTARITKGSVQRSKTIFASNLTGWSERKNGHTLIKAFSEVFKKDSNCELWMFGNGYGEAEEAQKWANINKLNQNIKFFGYIPYTELIKTFSENVNVLVHPAIEESFSMAVAEAMALGIPVIGGKFSGAVPDTLGAGGLLIDAKSKDEIATAMALLANDKKLQKNIGEQGRSLCNNKYHLSHVTDLYEKLYCQIITSNPMNPKQVDSIRNL
ncbi:MAG: glycosyltransferase family 1 protein [Chloroflexi bacterium HGW-Chloroflexi-4]|jgi:glycosyltransferase involved in cell wall biosynthesis|nr:MAG: glycosyltransferase family 1 protein [Chloroflexi bacterium HGW-Chloroflexi-4]